ncbi:uncharacterized protein [Chelonus insularis]|uniref:uncharacterized protein n=1 Tax=Chelonus insularis TaxID=460826 RepID=UPI00158ABF09|nr:uncharacterized protein LOC118064046 [Chelonus insularis]
MTSRLSYCMWFTTLITLDFVLSTTVLPIPIDLPDSKEENDFKNIANFKLKNEYKWNESSTETSAEKSSSVQVSREGNEIPEDISEEKKEFKEWNAKMRELTQKQLEKWNRLLKRNGENGKIKSCAGYRVVHKKDRSNVNSKSKSSLKIDSSSGDLNDKKNTNLKDDEKKSLFEEYMNSSKPNVLDDDKLTDRTKYQTGRWGMSIKIPPKEFLAETSTVREKSGKKNHVKEKNKSKKKKIHKGNQETSEFLNHSTNSRWGMSTVSPTEKSEKEEKNNWQKIESFNITSELSPPLKKDIESQNSNGSTRRSFQENDKVDRLSIQPPSKNIKIYSPIIILNPLIWMVKLPVGIKQQLGVVPDELANLSRDIHFINSSIILGQMRPARQVENNKENGNDDDGSISSSDQMDTFK